MQVPRRILLIRPSALGDVCRTVPALVTLKRAFPEAAIDWLVQENFADAVRHHPMLNAVVPFPRGRFGQWLLRAAARREFSRWKRALREQHYDLVVDLQGLARSGFFAFLTEAPRRVGYANARELGWIGCNVRHHVPATLHSVDRMLALLEAEGLVPVPDMTLHVSEADAAWLASQPWSAEPYALLAPTARWACKCWPTERYLEIARRLRERGLRVVVLAAPNEREAVAPFLPLAQAPSTHVGQMLALIARARIVVCNDSAALHMAVGFDRPAVAIFGPTDPALVGPYRRPDCVLQPPDVQPQEMRKYRRRHDDQSLISRVSLEQVWEKIQATLARD